MFWVWLWFLNWVKRYPLKTKVCFQPKCAFLNVLSIYKKIKVLKVAFLCRLIEQDQWHLLSFWTLQLYGIVNLIIIIAYIICFLARFFQERFRLIDWWNQAGVVKWVGSIWVKVSFSSNYFFISQPIYFILTHIVA